MKAKWAVTAAAILVVWVAAGCGSSPSPSAGSASGQADAVAVALYQSPEQATLSWFSAINGKDRKAAVAHFTAAAAEMMDWGYGDTATWPTFSALRCKQASRSGTAADVHCTFNESQAPADGNLDTFWDVSLERETDGRWLINNYGQG